MTLPLTRKQEQLWRYIQSCERSPTYDEMAVALGHKPKSRGNLNRMVVTLKEKGYVDYLPCRARSIVALHPRTDLSRAQTADLIGELERRGVVLRPLQ
jgi:SOS-response transcriptional repressor LexA